MTNMAVCSICGQRGETKLKYPPLCFDCVPAYETAGTDTAQEREIRSLELSIISVGADLLRKGTR